MLYVTVTSVLSKWLAIDLIPDTAFTTQRCWVGSVTLLWIGTIPPSC